jgi:hypothetical protein
METLDSLHVIKHDDGKEGVYYGTKLIGYVMKFEDGYYSFDFDRESDGWWSSYSLKLIADLLDALNEDWDKQVHDYFNSIEVNDDFDNDEWEGCPF